MCGRVSYFCVRVYRTREREQEGDTVFIAMSGGRISKGVFRAHGERDLRAESPACLPRCSFSLSLHSKLCASPPPYSMHRRRRRRRLGLCKSLLLPRRAPGDRTPRTLPEEEEEAWPDAHTHMLERENFTQRRVAGRSVPVV